MKILIRIVMLIVVVASLASGYYWYMQKQAENDLVPIESFQGQYLRDEAGNQYINLSGKLIYDEGIFYIERENGSQVAVMSNQVDLYMFRDKLVEVGARLISGQLNVFRIEEK